MSEREMEFAMAFTDLDDDLILEALQYVPKEQHTRWVKWLAVAACVCVLAGFAAMGLSGQWLTNRPNGWGTGTGYDVAEKTERESEEDIVLADAEADSDAANQQSDDGSNTEIGKDTAEQQQDDADTEETQVEYAWAESEGEVTDLTVSLANAFSLTNPLVVEELQQDEDFEKIYPDFASIYEDAASVVAGEVVEVQYLDEDAVPRTVYSFLVTDVWKGDVEADSLISVCESNGYIRLSTWISIYGEDGFENLTDAERASGVIRQSLCGTPLAEEGEDYVLFLGEREYEGSLEGAYAVIGDFMGKYVLDAGTGLYARFCPASDPDLYVAEDGSVEEPMSMEEMEELATSLLQQGGVDAYDKLTSSFSSASSGGEKAYPDYYGGSYINDDGCLVVEVVKGYETPKLSDEDVIYEDCTYSYNDLLAIMEVLNTYKLTQDNAITDNFNTFGISDCENRVFVMLDDLSETTIQQFKENVCDSDAILFGQGIGLAVME